MAADSGSRGPTYLLIAVLAATGYVGWQVAPLSRRMDEIDRDRLETNDRLQREIEKLRDDLERARLVTAAASGAAGERPSGAERGSSREPTSGRSPIAPATVATTAATPAPVRVSPTNAETFFNRRLFPEDAAIATLFVDGIPAAEIARRLRHSVAYIVAKGIQIEKELATAPDTPRDVLAALRTAVDRAKAQR
jgi:hypothetical protein